MDKNFPNLAILQGVEKVTLATIWHESRKSTRLIVSRSLRSPANYNLWWHSFLAF